MASGSDCGGNLPSELANWSTRTLNLLMYSNEPNLVRAARECCNRHTAFGDETWTEIVEYV